MASLWPIATANWGTREMTVRDPDDAAIWIRRSRGHFVVANPVYVAQGESNSSKVRCKKRLRLLFGAPGIWHRSDFLPSTLLLQ